MVRCKYCNDTSLFDDDGKCFIHLTKDILMNRDLQSIKEWIDSLYLFPNSKRSKRSKRCQRNNSLFRKRSFSGLLNWVFPHLLKQKQIYKRGDEFLRNLANYLLKKAKDNGVNVYPETLKTFLKRVKVDMKYYKGVLNETQFLVCIKKQGCSLDKALEYCFSKKRGGEMKEVINFYRKRDYIIYSSLHKIPVDVILMIIKILD
jgi:hypothetical protein